MNEEIVLLKEFLDFDVYPINDFIKDEFKGNNRQKTLIVLGTKSQTEGNQAFLQKIIAAVKFNLIEDTLIYSFNQEKPIPFAAICQNYDIEKVIFFDTNLKDLGLHIQLSRYQVINWNNIQLLNVDSLSKIEQDKKLKGGLWNALKAMFL